MIASAALLAALMRDKELLRCVSDVGDAPAAYIQRTWDFHRVILRSGERMIVAIAKKGCLVSTNSAMRVYRETGGAYRLVLSDNVMPETVDAARDGTISFAAHDTIDTIVEPVYVWNGNSYALAPERSHVYDVSVEARRPYQIAVHFAAGTSSIVLRGTYSENFGNTYVFAAKAGQRATIEVLESGKRPPGVALTFGERSVADASGRWSGTLPFSGTYALDVFGFDLPSHATLVPYAIRLTIR